MKKLFILVPIFIALIAVTTADSHSQQYEEAMNVIDAAGKRQGAWIITAAMMKLGPPWAPQQTVLEGNYKDSYRTGTWTEYNSSGKKITEWIYDLGNHHLQTKRYAGSELIAETNYSYTLHDHLETFTDNRGTYSAIVPGEIIQHEGVAKTYYPDGTLWVEMTWKDGRLDGLMKTYYPNGQLCEEGTWRYNYWTDAGYRLFNKSGKQIGGDEVFITSPAPVNY